MIFPEAKEDRKLAEQSCLIQTSAAKTGLIEMKYAKTSVLSIQLFLNIDYIRYISTKMNYLLFQVTVRLLWIVKTVAILVQTVPVHAR